MLLAIEITDSGVSERGSVLTRTSRLDFDFDFDANLHGQSV